MTPSVVSAPSLVNTPSVAFKPSVYSADPAANPEPFFFGNFGANYFNNNIGGKVHILINLSFPQKYSINKSR